MFTSYFKNYHIDSLNLKVKSYILKYTQFNHKTFLFLRGKVKKASFDKKFSF